MKISFVHSFVLLALSSWLAACGGGDVPVPKPRSYPRVDFPEKSYQAFSQGVCPFTFEYPVYASIQQDTSFFEEAPPGDCWFDVYFPQFDGRVHFTYYPVQGSKGWEQLQQDAFRMADWHNKRANYIDELRIQTGHVSGMAFDIEGHAASPFQFFLTDSTHHFVRGALYFNTQVRPDSLQPVVDFVREDILHIIETMRWAGE